MIDLIADFCGSLFRQLNTGHPEFRQEHGRLGEGKHDENASATRAPQSEIIKSEMNAHEGPSFGWLRLGHAKLKVIFLRFQLLAANALAHALKRNTSLNHLAQAARTVLTNPAQTSTMLADLSRLDICSIHVRALDSQFFID